VRRPAGAPVSRRVPVPLVRLGLTAFRRLPYRLRLWVVRAGTPSFTVGALVLVRRGGQVLLVRQRHTGAWALPGGLLARGEDADAALLREVDEELGVALDLVALGPPVGVVVDPRPRRVDVLYVLDVADGTPPPSGRSPEVLETGWFEPDALPALTPVTPAIVAEYGRLNVLPAGRVR
jgi:8-oxo-dGTP diphosphatase